jgi:hypothetical protein
MDVGFSIVRLLPSALIIYLYDKYISAQPLVQSVISTDQIQIISSYYPSLT